MVNVGGFFASLQIKNDEKSMSLAIAGIGQIRESVKKADEGFGTFIKGALQGLLNLGAAALGASGALAMISAKQAVVAKNAGLNAQEFTNWSKGFELIHQDSSAFLSSMAQINSAMEDFKIGINPEKYKSLAESLALLKDATGQGIDMNRFSKMNQNERASEILRRVELYRGKPNEVAMLDLGEQILPGLKNYEQRLAVSGKTSAQNIAEARLYGPQNATNNQQQNVKTDDSIGRLGVTVGGILDDGITGIGTSLRPMIDALTQFFVDNRENFKLLFKNIGDIASAILKIVGPILSMASSLLFNVFKDLDQAKRAGAIYSAVGAGGIAQTALNQSGLKDTRAAGDVSTDILRNFSKFIDPANRAELQKYTSSFSPDFVKKQPLSTTINGQTINIPISVQAETAAISTNPATTHFAAVRGISNQQAAIVIESILQQIRTKMQSDQTLMNVLAGGN